MTEETGLSFSWDPKMPLFGQARDRLRYMVKWLDAPTLAVILPFLKHEGPVSLRIIEWFATNYSKLHEPQMYEKYIQFRDVWKRPLFDCFARQRPPHCPIIWLHYQEEKYRTTVAQIQYLLWAHHNGFLAYCVTHEEAIETHMASVMAESSQSKALAKKIGVPRKRATLTPVQIHTPCVVHTVETRLSLAE